MTSSFLFFVLFCFLLLLFCLTCVWKYDWMVALWKWDLFMRDVYIPDEFTRRGNHWTESCAQDTDSCVWVFWTWCYYFLFKVGNQCLRRIITGAVAGYWCFFGVDFTVSLGWILQRLWGGFDFFFGVDFTASLGWILLFLWGGFYCFFGVDFTASLGWILLPLCEGSWKIKMANYS